MFLFPKLGGTLGGHTESSIWITWHSSCPKVLNYICNAHSNTTCPLLDLHHLFGLFFVLNHLLPHATHAFHRSQDKEVTHAYERTWEIGGVDLFFRKLNVVLQKVIKKTHRIITNRYKQATQRIICSLSQEDGLFVQILNTGSLALASPDTFFVVDHLF